jgi:hypothetical protein
MVPFQMDFFDDLIAFAGGSWAFAGCLVACLVVGVVVSLFSRPVVAV